ncbi:MAG: WecB/TagA/CpsF family glycosyltransferase [Bacillota bacterium]|nr:WecB/TagA/CpsF family glycosyltransferase [Bacillota bacterium]
MEKIRVLGVDFSNVTLESAADRAMDMLASKSKGYIVTPNSEIVYECLKNDALNKAVNDAALVLPDGIGVIYASNIYKTRLKGKVAGIDFASEFCRRMKDTDYSLFLLGAKPGIAGKAAEELLMKYPGLHINGVRDGYFANDDEAIKAVNEAAPDVVFVCLGAPKQELFMRANAGRINATVLVGLGGSLDVFAGVVNRAPDIFIKLGLEWFYRLLKEPKRIGRMMRLPLFLTAAAKDSLKGGKRA